MYRHKEAQHAASDFTRTMAKPVFVFLVPLRGHPSVEE